MATDTYLCVICEYRTRKEITSFELDSISNHMAKLDARTVYLSRVHYGSLKSMKDVEFDIEVVKL